MSHPRCVLDTSSQSCHAQLLTQNLQGHVDGWRYARTRYGYSNRLRNLAQTKGEFRRDLLDCFLDVRRTPRLQSSELFRHCAQRGDAFSCEILLRRLLIVLNRFSEEEDAVLRHLLERLRALLLRLRDRGKLRIVVHLDTECLELRLQMLRKMLRCRTHDVLLVQPQQLIGIERRGRFVYVFRVEELRHFIEREHFLIAVRPAEANEIIEQRLWEITLLSILEHADRTVSLRKLGAVGAQNHGDMRISRR